MKKMRVMTAGAAALLAVCSASVSAYAQSVVDFEDGNYSFVSMKTDDGGDASVLSVVDFNGSKQLKVDVQDCANVPKVNFSINQLLASDDFDKVKTIEMEITFESKDGATPIGWAGGAIGTQGGEKSPAWAQTSWECGEYENPVSEVTVIQRKFLLPSEKFVNGTENTDMLLMRWGSDVAYNMYVDNIRFLDESGNEIELAIENAAAETTAVTEAAEAPAETAAEETAEEAAPEETTASTENTDVTEVPESDEKTTSTTTGNTAAAAAATAVVISGYAVAMTRKKNK